MGNAAESATYFDMPSNIKGEKSVTKDITNEKT